MSNACLYFLFLMLYSFKCSWFSLHLAAENEEAFDILYCISFEMMDAQWLAMHASYMDFNVCFLFSILGVNIFPYNKRDAIFCNGTRTLMMMWHSPILFGVFQLLQCIDTARDPVSLGCSKCNTNSIGERAFLRRHQQNSRSSCFQSVVTLRLVLPLLSIRKKKLSSGTIL